MPSLLPKREFLFADNLADGCLHLLNMDNAPDHVNIGAGTDLTIQESAGTISQAVGFKGRIENDLSKPDGTPGRLMDSKIINRLGWRP